MLLAEETAEEDFEMLLLEEAADVEAEEMCMDVLEEETGLQPQQAPSQEATPQTPLHVSAYPGQQSRMSPTHISS